MPYRELSPSLAQWTVQTLTRLTATYAIGQGLGIIIGGASRWGSKALRVALSVPGAPASWGVVLVTFGAIALWLTFRPHRARLVIWPMSAIAAWSSFFAIALVPSVVERGSRVATTGGPTYVYIALVAAVLGVAYRRSVS